jgi:hypothetical protein
MVGTTDIDSSTNCVRPSIVVLKNISMEVHYGQHVWCQNLISVSNGVMIAEDMHQLSFSGVGYGTPHHHTSSVKIVDFKDAVSSEPLIRHNRY